ncbi:hypothetical protein AGLY_014036 [Aphis glycines]|uniref:Uncharacterized protein n=1 Tax=Aphis glycines TaxID=307491 RepID=A0A6G0T4J5_APHGL|nr:hypothetical protein AGLY_014036 [Aphis glycines]
MPESDILDISSQYETDSKITKIEFHSYTPYTTSFKNNDEIRISIQQTDVYPYLHESFIYLEGKITEAGKVLLSNNGFSYLFDQIRLEINGIEVDSTRVLGITSSLKGYLSGTPVDYYCYENAGWTFKNNTKSTNNAGEFSACIPLKYWLGLFEDFKKILVNSRLELILTRSHSDLNAINVKSEGSATTGAVTLNKIVWKVPHITVDDEERLKLLKLVEKEKSLFIPFRSFETFEYPELGTTTKAVWNLKTASKLEKPRFIIVGLQKDRKNQISKDCSVFDKCDLTNVKVFLNSIAYPYDNLNLDFNKNNFSILYDMYTSFQESYYEKKIRNPQLSPSTFLENAPIVVIDTSKQNDSGTASSVDVQLEIEASKPLTGVSAYCLLIHDRIVEYVPFTREVRKLLTYKIYLLMDNAPYHSVNLEKCPTSNWRNADIIQWLQGKGEVVDQTMIIPELLEVVRRIKPIYNKYVIDEMVLQQNKTVLRLPPYHCELNPIELVWSVVKRHVKANNKTFKLPDVKNLLVEGIAKVDAEMWKNFVKHTIEEKNKLWTLDDTVDELTAEQNRLVMTIGNSDTEEDDDFDLLSD